MLPAGRRGRAAGQGRDAVIRLRPCPECRLTPTLYPQPDGKWYWRCRECSRYGERGNTQTKAARNWNRHAKRGAQP